MDKCKEYIREYLKLNLDKIIIDKTPMNDDIFLDKINDTNKLISEILKNDKIKSSARENLINKDSELYQNYFDNYKKEIDSDKKIIIQKTMIELAKRQLHVLIEGLCAKCKNDKLILLKCRNYINEYNNLNFVKFANNIVEFNNDKFNQDLRIAYDLIKKINDENNNMFIDLVNIDDQIMDFFKIDNIESKNLIIRKEVGFLMIEQLYTMLRILCNICKEKLKYHFNLDLKLVSDDIRSPHEVKKNDPLQEIQRDRHNSFSVIYHKLINNKELNADDQKFFYHILADKIDDGEWIENRTKQIYLKDFFMEWLHERIMNQDLTPVQKIIIFCLFTDAKLKSFWHNFLEKYKMSGIDEKYINKMYDDFVAENLKSIDTALKNFFQQESVLNAELRKKENIKRANIKVNEKIKQIENKNAEFIGKKKEVENLQHQLNELRTLIDNKTKILNQKNKEHEIIKQKKQDFEKQKLEIDESWKKSKKITIADLKLQKQQIDSQIKELGILNLESEIKILDKDIKMLEKIFIAEHNKLEIMKKEFVIDNFKKELFTLQSELAELENNLFLVKKTNIDDIVNENINEYIKELETYHDKDVIKLTNYLNKFNKENTKIIGYMTEIGVIMKCYKKDVKIIINKLGNNIANIHRINLYKMVNAPSGFKGGNLENIHHSSGLLHLKKIFYKLSKKLYLLTTKFNKKIKNN
jgi:hypothetical protein